MQKHLFSGTEIFKILPLTHEILSKKLHENYNFTEKEDEILSIMIDTLKLYQNYTKHPELTPLALAAPQVGWSKRLFICANFDRIPHKNKVLRKIDVFINPEILEFSNNLIRSEEVCLSLPEKTAAVMRPDKIVMRYYNLMGKEQAIEVNGKLACLYQHEIDHLDGITVLQKAFEFVDKVN